MKSQNWIIGSQNSNTEDRTDLQANTAWNPLQILKAGILNGMFKKDSEQLKIVSDEICNFLITAGKTIDPTNSSQMASVFTDLKSEIADVVAKTFSFKGYVSETAPSSSSYVLNVGDMWIDSANMPTTIPIPASSISIWNGTTWESATDSYTPATFDTFSDLDDGEGYYWFGGEWKVISTDLSLDYFTLNTATGKWEIKSDVNLPGNPTTTTQLTSDNSTKLATTEFVKNVVLSSGGANVNLSNLTSQGKNIANWSTNVSNCITEILQDIKLELNNGVLTLKAGSKVYVPNGAGVFDEIVINSDKTASISSFSGFVFYRSDNNSLHLESLQPTSGTTPPSGDGTWYDTNANKIKRYENSSFVYDGISFPLCKCSSGSIDQVFNGFGYIGSTVFALPGVVGLAPDGFNNVDGVFNSNIKSVSNVLTYTLSGTHNFTLACTGSAIGAYFYSYDARTNQVIRTDTGVPYNGDRFIYGNVSVENGKIASFNTKTVFHAADDNDAVHKTGNETISDVKTFTGVSGGNPYIRLKNLNRSYMDSPTTDNDKNANHVFFIDKNDVLFGAVETWIRDSGNYIQINVNRNNHWATSPIGMGVDNSGFTWTFCPNPRPSDSGNEIATASFVKTYLQYVNVLPVSPDSNCFYAIPE